MSTSITQAFVTQFQDLVIHAITQSKARLRGAVREKTGVKGSDTKFNKLDTSDPYTGTRHGDTIWADDTHAVVTCSLYDYFKALPIDELDALKTMVSLENEYTKNVIAAFERQIDKVIVTKGITQGAGTYSITGGSNTGLQFAEVAKAAALAEDLEWSDEDRYFGWTGQALRTLLDDAQLTSRDYRNTVQAIMDGRFSPDERWMGFKWRKLNQAHLAAVSKRTGAIGSVTAETYYAWCKDGIGLAVGAEYQVRIGERPDKNYSKQVFGRISLGACAIDSSRIIEVPCTYT